MRILTLFLILLALPLQAAEPERYVVYYADKAAAETFFPYSLAVFDSQHHPKLAPLKEKNMTLLGYLSLGEVEMHRPYFIALKKQNLILHQNPDWPESYYVDLRNDAWAKRVVEELIPAILAQGFDGIFFDTLDNPSDLERRDPKKYKGMTAAAVKLVKAIRYNFPKVPLMINRGYDILPEMAGDVDMLMAESLYSDHDAAKKIYKHVDDETHQEQLKRIAAAKKTNPKLRVYSLDYWDPKDTNGIAAIYDYERKQGFVPYVATIGLDAVIPEPAVKP